jgi:hypothetical protein
MTRSTLLLALTAFLNRTGATLVPMKKSPSKKRYQHDKFVSREISTNDLVDALVAQSRGNRTEIEERVHQIEEDEKHFALRLAKKSKTGALRGR